MTIWIWPTIILIGIGIGLSGCIGSWNQLTNRKTKIMKIFVSLLPAILIWGVLLFQNFGWAMDKLKQHHTFEEALRALKDGKIIHQAELYSTRYGRIEIHKEGKVEVKYGSIDRRDDFRSGLYFNEKEVFADNWIIED